MKFEIKGANRETGQDVTVVIDALTSLKAGEQAYAMDLMVESITPMHTPRIDTPQPNPATQSNGPYPCRTCDAPVDRDAKACPACAATSPAVIPCRSCGAGVTRDAESAAMDTCPHCKVRYPLSSNERAETTIANWRGFGTFVKVCVTGVAVLFVIGIIFALIGETYTLGSLTAPGNLVPVPSDLVWWVLDDDTSDADVNVAPGTKCRVLEIFEVPGRPIRYVKVRVLKGPHTGHEGFVTEYWVDIP